MIHLANDPDATRHGWRASQEAAKGCSFEYPRSRGRHAWPFPSRYADRPAPENASKTSRPGDSQ
jgi:hypothetical protein